MKISRKKLNNMISEAIGEVFDNGQEVDYVALVNFCLTNDFYFFAKMPMGDRGLQRRCANTTQLQKVIASEILQADNLEFSNDLSNMVSDEMGKVVKIKLKNETYYVLWEQ